MKSFLTGVSATVIAAVGLFFLLFKKRSTEFPSSTTEMKKADDKANVLKAEISDLEKQFEKLVIEERSLDSELDYWNKEKK